MEAKHDVVKNGMQGFYANLLTKNIATGADVDKNATSAYTAGGRRIDKALTGGDKSSVVKEDEDVAKDSGTGAYDNGKKLEKRDRQEHVPEEEGNEHNPEEDASKSSSSVSLEVKKEVKIMSARDRYLARKKEQQLQVNDKE
jgi:coiled-coil domain-containing protein 55